MKPAVWLFQRLSCLRFRWEPKDCGKQTLYAPLNSIGGRDRSPYQATYFRWTQPPREAARMLQKLPMEMMADAMIAATASVNGLTVATRNTKHFAKFGVPLVNPFEHRQQSARQAQ